MRKNQDYLFYPTQNYLLKTSKNKSKIKLSPCLDFITFATKITSFYAAYSDGGFKETIHSN